MPCKRLDKREALTLTEALQILRMFTLPGA
jgi:hypothetical protein